MAFVLFVVLNIRLNQLMVSFNYQQIFGILALGRRCKVKAARDQCRSVDYDHLVMSNGVLVINKDWYAGVGKKRRNAIFCCDVTLVQDRFDINASFLSVKQSLCYGL